MAQDKVQLKREEVVGNDVVMQDINPKTTTNSITDSSKGTSLDQTLALIKNMINNKLSRYVNSVNGRSGVVVLDANDVGLGNVDNVSFGDIKKWVIEYMGDIFGTKRIILREYLSQIHTITGTNDKAYDNTPFFTQKGIAGENDFMSYIGCIVWDSVHEVLTEEHLQINVVGFTDASLIYNENVGDRHLAGGGLGVNIWTGEDALKIKDDLEGRGLYIDKTKLVPNVFFFDGVYGTLTGSGSSKHSDNDALVWWSATDQEDPMVETLPAIIIRIDGTEITRTASGGSTQQALHTPQNLKKGDIIITNFSYGFNDEYMDPDHPDLLYPKMADSLTCRMPAIGYVTQTPENDLPCIVDFYSTVPNVSHGLRILKTNNGLPDGGAIGLDTLEKILRTRDDVPINSTVANISGINAFDKYSLDQRRTPQNSSLYTVYPTGKSNNVFTDESSAFILPNFSMCIIPGFTFSEDLSQARPIINWDPTSPVGAYSIQPTDSWNMIGVNLEKMMLNSSIHSEEDNWRYARNISGLRVNTDTAMLDYEWFGFENGDIESVIRHSGGLSVNVGDFLEIGTPSEVNGSVAETVIRDEFYTEGKVNVRIDNTKGLYNSGGNKLAVNLANGSEYGEDSFISGGLDFVSEGGIRVNTGGNASGLSVKNNFHTGTIYESANNPTEIVGDNVLTIEPFQFNRYSQTLGGTAIHEEGIEIHTGLTESDIARKIPIRNLYKGKMWNGVAELVYDMTGGTTTFDTDHVYVAGGNYYIYDDTPGASQICKPYFVFYSDQDEYDAVIDILEGNVLDPILSRQCHVLIKDMDDSDSYRVTVKTYAEGEHEARLPDIDGNGKISADDASLVDLVARCYVNGNDAGTMGGKIYSNQDHTRFYGNASQTTEFVPTKAGIMYWDTTDTDPFPMVYESVQTPGSDPAQYYLRKLNVGGSEGNYEPITHEKLLCMDIDRNGRIMYRDGGGILQFFTALQETSRDWEGASTLTEKWCVWIKNKYGINVTLNKTITLFDGVYNKGLRIRIDEKKGLTAAPEYYGEDSDVISRNDFQNAIGIKIADSTSGMHQYDPTINGGLRFCYDGYLGIRINDKHRYDATSPVRNNDESDDLSSGTHGLRIYSGNILGVQLSTDGATSNGDLRIDENGCLRLNSNIGNMKTLKFKYGNTEVPYNGSDDVTINLGPGLCITSGIG